jgi:hypothetical protein
MVTNRYRFLLLRGAELLELAALGLTIRDRFFFAANERICALADWERLTTWPQLLVVTSLGAARAYDGAVLGEQIGGPAPLQFDDPPAGLPAFVLGAERAQDLVLLLDSSRAVRLPLNALPHAGGAVYNRHEGEALVGAAVVRGEQPLVALTAAGFARRFTPAHLPAADRLNSRGRSLLSRPDARGLAAAVDGAWALTDRRLVRLDLRDLPLARSTRTVLALSLAAGERVLGVLPDRQKESHPNRVASGG